MRAESNVMLSDRTSLRLGGPAKRLVTVDSEEELAQAAREARASGGSLFVLGGGSNLVVGDDGCDETLVSLAMSEITRERSGDVTLLRVQAGHDWDALVALSVAEGLAGLECLSGIPGRVGATPIQNVGAYGQEIADTLKRVRVFDQEAGTFTWWSKEACGFAYRHSLFRGNRRTIVTEVEIALHESSSSRPIRYAELAKALGVSQGQEAPLAELRRTVIELRRGKGMVLDASDPESVSAGSFFTNPIVSPAVAAAADARAGRSVPRFPAEGDRVKLPAAWLVEASGFTKGHAIGKGASISKKHALALVNRGGTTADLLALAREIRAGVAARFEITLEPEPIFVGCSL